MGSFIQIPLPPSWNAVYKISPARKLYMTAKGKEWKQNAIESIQKQIEKSNDEMAPGKVSIVYDFYMKTPERSDLDNRLKLTNDVLQEAGAIENDDRIYMMIARKYGINKGEEPHVKLWIYDFVEL